MMKHQVILAILRLCVLIFAAISSPSIGLAQSGVPNDANTLLLLRFEGNTTGVAGETPVQATGITFESGVLGQGALIDGTDLLQYLTSGNFNAAAGTVEFWIKPRWNGSDTTTRLLFAVGDARYVPQNLILEKDGANNLAFIINSPDSEGGRVYNVGQWQANQWHHIAITWSIPGQMKIYADGVERTAFSSVGADLMNPVPPLLTIGSLAGPLNSNAVFDDLRISNISRSAGEIAATYANALTVSSFTVQTITTEMYQTWQQIPTITAMTNLGTVNLPPSAATWTTSDSSIATVNAAGQITAVAAGQASITAIIQGHSISTPMTVRAPVRQPIFETVDATLAQPAVNSLYEIPVVGINFLPTLDGNLNDTSFDPNFYELDPRPVDSLRASLRNEILNTKFAREQASRFRGYRMPSALPALGYRIVAHLTIFEPSPPGRRGFTLTGHPIYRPDFHQIFNRFNLAHYINNLGVKEVWMFIGGVTPDYACYNPNLHTPDKLREIPESNLASPVTDDISNSNRDPGDLPIYNRTYTVYGGHNRSAGGGAGHIQGHQLEALLSYVNILQDGNTDLFWKKFVGQNASGQFITGRCGWTHMPPNTTINYDYTNPTLVESDIEDWTPDRLGQTKLVNIATWRDLPYAWPVTIPDPFERAAQNWLLYWMQNMPGRGNTIPYNTNRMTNWWQFTADWDAAIQRAIGLYEPASCSYQLSATSQSFPLGGGTGSVNVTAGTGCKWMASSNVNWVTVNNGGNGNGTVNITVAANGGAPRTGTIAIANQTFTVNQAGPCSYSVTPMSQSFTANGGSGSVALTASDNACAWTATSNATWITLASSSGTGSGAVGYVVAANPDPNSRTGTVTIAGQTFTVNQSGCAFTINPTSQNFTASGGSGSVSVTASGSACAWTAASNAVWITITSGSSGTGSGATQFSVAANIGPQRSGTLTIAGQTFTVTQDSGCSFTINPASQNFTASGGSGSFGVATATGCSWTATSQAQWITITSGSSGVGNGTVQFSVAANTGSSRTGAITVTGGQMFTVTQDGVTTELQYYPLPFPVRLLETRPGESGCFAPGVPLGNDAIRTQQATGSCGGVTIPPTAKAIVGNATVVNFISSGFHWITLYPSDAAQPNASNLNFSDNQIVPNNFTVGLGPDGAFKIYSHASTHFIVDITGYYAPPGAGGLYYHPLPAPVRLFESRLGEQGCDAPGVPLANEGTRTVLAHRTCLGATIPSSARSVVGNATVVNFISSGFHWITLYPFGTTQPNASNLNFTANQIVPNAFVVGLSSDGKFNIYSHAATHFIVDVTGYFSDEVVDVNGQGLLYTALPTPVRLLETRPGESGCDAPGVPLGNDATRTQMAHRTCFGVTVPSTAKAVVGNATVVNFISSGFHWITLYPFGAAQPNASNLNFSDNQIVPNAFVVGLSNDGKFNLYSHAATHFIVDLTGYFAP
jgi:hypothetical protein